MSPLIGLCTWLGLFGLSAMIVPGIWLRTVATAIAVTCVAVMAVRLLSSSRVLPTLAGALAAVAVMVPLFVRNDDGSRRLLPTPGALRELGAVLERGVDYATTTYAPAPISLDLCAVVTAGALVLFLAAEHVAVSWRATASSGLLLVLPWLPAVVFQQRVPSAALLVALVAWLMALALSRKTAGVESRPSPSGAVVATAATMGIALLVAPTALGGLGWGSFPRIDAPSSPDTATRLDLDLDLRNSLTSNSTTPILIYEAHGRRPDAFRLYALTDFDGARWAREATDIPSTLASSGMLWTQPVEDWDNRERQRVDIQVLGLEETNLPMPPTPRTVDVDGPWFYDAERDEVVGNGATSRDVQYSVVTDHDYTSADDLRAAQEAIDAGEDPTDPRYLDLAAAMDDSRVAALTAEVTAEADTRYDAAMAIQQFLRDPTEFSYDTAVTPRGGDSVSAFLDSRSGYCVQFATTMIAMARSIGIPARMAVGFLAGELNDDGAYVVYGADAHAWPELWFPGVGWVRFEPTPGVQTGAPPTYADPTAGQAVNPQVPLPGLDTPATPQPQVPIDRPGTDLGAGAEESPLLSGWVLATIVVLALAAVALAGAWWWWRRGRAGALRRSARDAEQVWDHLRDELPEPMRWPLTLTPHEAAAHLDEAFATLGGRLTPHAREAFARLSLAVSDQRYSPAGSTVDIVDLRACADTVRTEATAVEVESRRVDARD
ncbi:transglutaminaseTgpA domain-containing protein [Demequina sp.]|uniref:transglutaminase family protein n=1 Tax=Demequina sp. TaxID=2050685 RepID=UPI003A86EEB9